MPDKALFVPLKAEFFDAFANGTKKDELRRYGPRWNERTCTIGRPVVLSKGYGRAHRLTGRVAGVQAAARLHVREHVSRGHSTNVRHA